MCHPVANERGTTLVGTIVLLFVISTFAIAYLTFAGYEAESAEARWKDLKIFWKAEEAISRAGIQIQNLESPSGKCFKTDPDDEYYAEYCFEKLSFNKAIRYQIMASVYSIHNKNRSLLTLRSIEEGQTLVNYFMLENTPGRPYYDTGDTIDGPIHTNTRFQITGRPVFLGPVFEFGDPEIGFKCRELALCEPVLPKGITPNATVFDFSHMADLIQSTPNQIVVPYNKTAVISLGGGQYTLRFRDKNNEHVLTPPVVLSLPKSEGLYFLGDVEVQGTLAGKLTIGAQGNIWITDDLLYADSNPITGEPAPSSPYVLGLIAEQNVKVKQQQDRSQLGKGIKINAAIVAMDKSFEVTNYRRHARSMGVMHLWGNIVQWERGIVGSSRLRGTIKLGYDKNWHYDKRLVQIPPAYFPPLTDLEGRMLFKAIYWDRI